MQTIQSESPAKGGADHAGLERLAGIPMPSAAHRVAERCAERSTLMRLSGMKIPYEMD
jgi:hypothetical protein